MEKVRLGIATVAYGERYERAAKRQVEAFDRGFCDIPFCVTVFDEPICFPSLKDGWDYTGYMMKPGALLSQFYEGARVGLLLDAIAVPIAADLSPLVAYILEHGYFWYSSGHPTGLWCSDEILREMGVSRDEAMCWDMPSSQAVGLDFSREECVMLAHMWAMSWPLIPGHHSNVNAGTKQYSYRNEGWVSDDPRCLGHRHDQSSLAIISHQLGMTRMAEPNSLVAVGRENVGPQTVIVMEGI